MSTVLVTGGAGYVGSHACKALAAAGHIPVTYDSLSRGHRHAVKWGPLEVGDILDRDRLTEVFETHKPDAVMHFAAFAYVGESVEQPDMYFRNNVEGSAVLLEAMKTAGVRHFVFSSSCVVYGVPSDVPIKESSPTQPINPYGETKLKVERLLAEREKTDDVSWIALRYFNAAGADPDSEIGEEHDPEPHLIPRVLEAAAGRDSLTINGNDYPTDDGTCVRDYIHVSDLATAHIKALDLLTAGGLSGAMNLGTGLGHSILNVIRTAERVTGSTIAFEIGDRRPGDPPALVANSTKAAAALDWQPERSDLDTIIEDAWRWSQRL